MPGLFPATPGAIAPPQPRFPYAATPGSVVPLSPAQSVQGVQGAHGMHGMQGLPLHMFGAASGQGGPVNPADFIWAVSSRLPVVEEASPDRSTASDPSPVPLDAARARSHGAGRTVKVSWYRPHGKTAIAPGLKKVTLKVRVNTPSWEAAASPAAALDASAGELLAPDGFPATPVMLHLLDVFRTHLGAQFPLVGELGLEAGVENRTASLFLLLAIAATAARFSKHPLVALPDLEPHEYGKVFYARAKAMVGSMLGFPSREAIAAFVLLAHMGFSEDSESEVWMFTGLAVRMSLDFGLHLTPPPESESGMGARDRRLNRLTFWSVLLMDYALSFGVGRQTAFRPEDITQTLPSEDDIGGGAPGAPGAGGGGSDGVRSPFPYAARMMLSYGPLINALNRGHAPGYGGTRVETARAAAIKEYARLPPDMQWSVANLQAQNRARHGSIFLHLHLWMHTILASEYLTGTDLLARRPGKAGKAGKAGAAGAAGSKPPSASSDSGHLHASAAHKEAEKTAAGAPALAPTAPVANGTTAGAMTPNTAAASNLWRHSVRTIGDILVLSDIINPFMYFALPFVNQAWFVAGCCYVKEIEEARAGASGAPSRAPSPVPVVRAADEGAERSERGERGRGRRRSAAAGRAAEHGGGCGEPSGWAGGAEGKEGEEGDGEDDGEDEGGCESSGSESESGGGRPNVDLSRALLTSVATTNISTLQQGLQKLATYWYGAEWIAGTLRQRIEGIHDVDLGVVRENFASFYALPDAGIAGVPHARATAGVDPATATAAGPGATPGQQLAALGAGFSGDLGGFLSLPFDLESAPVTEQEVAIDQVLPNWGPM